MTLEEMTKQRDIWMADERARCKDVAKLQADNQRLVAENVVLQEQLKNSKEDKETASRNISTHNEGVALMLKRSAIENEKALQNSTPQVEALQELVADSISFSTTYNKDEACGHLSDDSVWIAMKKLSESVRKYQEVMK